MPQFPNCEKIFNLATVTQMILIGLPNKLIWENQNCDFYIYLDLKVESLDFHV